ncbi:MAG: TA system VapC family ribonuclease toxin [Bryobacteraceae bacterium]
MSVALLDVNILIAMFDTGHTHHQRAQAWFTRESPLGWATCPITVTGAARILSSPAYPSPMPLADALSRIQIACDHPTHVFWPDDVSILEESLFRREQIGNHKKLTDAYLLGLAVRHRGRLATFDRGLPLRAVIGAGEEHLCLLG